MVQKNDGKKNGIITVFLLIRYDEEEVNFLFDEESQFLELKRMAIKNV